jgi:hypothetical protein
MGSYTTFARLMPTHKVGTWTDRFADSLYKIKLQVYTNHLVHPERQLFYAT